MENFTSMTNKEDEFKNDEFLWKGDYIKVKDIEGWECVIENDYVIIVPHLIDYDQILLRREAIPPFKHVTGGNMFLTAISGKIENGEEVESAIFRELEEEAGIKLHTGYRGWKKWNECFLNKGSVGKYHIYYLPLHNYEFTLVGSSGDGSLEEAKSTTVKINTKYLNNLKPADIVTTLCIEYLKKEI